MLVPFQIPSAGHREMAGSGPKNHRVSTREKLPASPRGWVLLVLGHIPSASRLEMVESGPKNHWVSTREKLHRTGQPPVPVRFRQEGWGWAQGPQKI